MKPNTAGPMAAGCGFLLLIATRRRIRLVLLTIAASAVLALFLTVNHIDLVGLVQSYRTAAAARGLSTFGLDFMKPKEIVKLGFLIVLLVLPAMLRWLALVRDALPRFDIRALSCLAMLLLGPVVGLFAMVTNGEMKDTDFPLLIIFGIFMLWGRPDHPAFIYSRKSTIWTSATMLRLYASLLFGFASSELYMGYARERVAFAEHLFFERNDSDQNPGIAYFQHMRSSHQMRDVVSQMTEVIHSSAQPIFLGPSLEFGYAAFHLPPTMHLPVWWWPGSAYGPADEPLLLDQWKRNKYATAIFFRKGGSYMPPGMMPMVQDSYTKDDRWPELIVYRLPQADRH